AGAHAPLAAGGQGTPGTARGQDTPPAVVPAPARVRATTTAAESRRRRPVRTPWPARTRSTFRRPLRRWLDSSLRTAGRWRGGGPARATEPAVARRLRSLGRSGTRRTASEGRRYRFRQADEAWGQSRRICDFSAYKEGSEALRLRAPPGRCNRRWRPPHPLLISGLFFSGRVALCPRDVCPSVQTVREGPYRIEVA